MGQRVLVLVEVVEEIEELFVDPLGLARAGEGLLEFLFGEGGRQRR